MPLDTIEVCVIWECIHNTTILVVQILLMKLSSLSSQIQNQMSLQKLFKYINVFPK